MLNEIREHLKNGIIPFWEGLKDEEFGGYYGYMDYDLKLDKKFEKGCILNSRILWFFSSVSRIEGFEKEREYADHAYQFLKEKCLVQECGGVFWSVTYDGKPLDTTKHTYNQAFAIYALSSYYDTTGNEEALEIAKGLQKIIEEKCTDEFGYLEAFNRNFQPEENDKLSENGVIAEKTMNTLLHVFEAYTEFYRVTKDKFTGDRLRFMLDIFADKVYNPAQKRQEVFFDREWNTLIDLYSYGHDIETSWLIDRGLEVLDDPAYTAKVAPITKEILANVYKTAYRDHSLMNECENGVNDTTRVWWVQAESVVGFLNGYQKDPAEKKYLQAAEDVWDYIKNYMIDKRNGSEWYWCIHEDHTPVEKPIVEPWKCPYHNGCMCIEVIRRMKDIA